MLRAMQVSALRLFTGLLAISLLAPIFPADSRAATEQPWIDSGHGLEVDPSLSWGRLENGLRYVLKHQPHPVGATSLRLVVLTGFLHESPEERGLAHFVEHMGFNDTRNFRGESLAKKLGAEGIRMGPELTAFTFPSHTIYQLDLPNSAPAKLKLGVTVLREWAREIRFRKRQVEREKGVIVAEYHARGHARSDFIEKRLSVLYPDSLLSARTGGATPQEINAVTPARLQAFYEKWYRPDNIFIVGAGDFDPADLHALINDAFADWPRPEAPLPQIEIGEIGNHPSTRATLVHNQEVKSAMAELTMVAPRNPSDSLDRRRNMMAIHIAINALQRRLNALSRSDPGRFGELGVSTTASTPFSREMRFYGAESRINWDHLCKTLLDEYRRLRSFGFLPEELEAPRRHMLKASELQMRNHSTRPAAAVAQQLCIDFIWGFTPVSPEFARDLTQQVLPEITAEECLAALRPYFQSGFPALILAFDYDADLTTQRVGEFLNGTLQEEVGPPEVPELPEFPYTEFGEPGEIVHRTHDAALDVHMVEFANGVKLNLKRTEFDAETVWLTARIENGGQMGEPFQFPGLARVASSSLMEGGLGKLDPEQLQTALAGHIAQLGFHVGESASRFNGRADAREVELLLQLLTAYLTDAAVRDEAVTFAKQGLNNGTSTAFLNVDAALGWRSSADFFRHDRRFALIAPDGVNRIAPEAVRAWLKGGFLSAPIELGLVGDIDIEATIAHAAATVGALPDRDLPPLTDPVTLQREPVRRHLKVESTEAQVGIMLGWHVQNLETARRRRTLEILSWILRNRLLDEIREKSGMTYSPDTSRWISSAAPGEGYLTARLTVSPADWQDTLRSLTRIAGRLGKRGPNEKELERARAPLVQGVSRQLNSNGYWLRYVVSEAQTDPEALQMPHTRASDLIEISREEVAAMAREVIDPDRALMFIASP